MSKYLEESYESVLRENEQLKNENLNLKEAFLDLQGALAAVLLKNGGSMDFNYHDFFEIRRNEAYEFTKHENFHNDTVTIKIRKRPNEIT